MRLALALLAAALLLPTADAHLVLLPGAGDSLEHASGLVAAPTRAFDEIAAPGGYHYYSINLSAGETVRLRLLARDDAFRPNFPPYLLVAGAGLNESGFRPGALSFPNGTNVTAYLARFALPDLRDERLPLRARTLVDATLTPPSSGRFVLVVYSGEFGGRYALWVEHPQGDALLDRFEAPFVRPQAWSWAGIPAWAPLGGALLGGLLAATALAPRRGVAWARVPERSLSLATLATVAGGSARLAAADWTGAPWGGAVAELALGLVIASMVWMPPAWPRRAGCVLLAAACAWLAAGWIVAPGLLLLAAVWMPKKA